MHPLFRDVPEHLSDAFDELPLVEGRVHDHVTRKAISPRAFRARYPELVRPLMSRSEALARLEARRPPPQVQAWIDDMLLRKGMRPDELILMWDPQMPRWSFWCRSKHAGAEEGYARVWVVGEQEGKSRGKATDLDERAEYYRLMGTMGPYRLPEKDEIDRVLGEIATLGPMELDAYLSAKEHAAEAEKERQFDDFTMDFLDYRNLIDAWKANGGIRTWCMQGQWLSDEERRQRVLAREGKRELDRGTYKVVVKKGSRFEEAELEDMRREAEAAKPDEVKVTQHLAREHLLGRVALRRVGGRTL